MELIHDPPRIYETRLIDGSVLKARRCITERGMYYYKCYIEDGSPQPKEFCLLRLRPEAYAMLMNDEIEAWRQSARF